jgi:glycosyltransferase involved in cell wall biosynthesis
VDDGSNDDTQSKLRQYGDRIRVLTQTNSGPAIARNRGAKAANGEIIAFQDSDDLWKPAKLQRQVELLEKNKSIPCCLCNVLMRARDGFTSFDHSLIRLDRERGLWLNVTDVLTTRFLLFNQAAAIRRQAFERVGGFAEDLKYLEDYDLPLRLSLEGPWALIREPLVIYGEASAGSFSAQATKDPVVLKQCEVKIYERMLRRIDGSECYGKARRNLYRRYNVAQRQLLAIQRQHTAAHLGKLLNFVDKYRLALFRRSPWFPQPITVAL